MEFLFDPAIFAYQKTKTYNKFKDYLYYLGSKMKVRGILIHDCLSVNNY